MDSDIKPLRTGRRRPGIKNTLNATHRQRLQAWEPGYVIKYAYVILRYIQSSDGSGQRWRDATNTILLSEKASQIDAVLKPIEFL